MAVRCLYPRELLLGESCMLRLYAEYHGMPEGRTAARDPAFSLFQHIEHERVVQSVRDAYPKALRRGCDTTAAGTGQTGAADSNGSRGSAGDGARVDRALSRRVAETRTLLQRREPLFDCCFAAAGIACRVELMLPVAEESWDLVLIRSASGLRGSYVREAACIRHCVEQSGYAVREIYVYYLNGDYVDGAADDAASQELLVSSRVTARARKTKIDVPQLVERAQQLLEMPASVLHDRTMSCNGGHSCPVCRRFEAELPRHNVFTLHRGGRQVKELLARGVASIAEIEETSMLTDKQHVQWRAVVEDALQVDQRALESFLSRACFPLSFLDFEAFQQAVPRSSGVVPWQHLPFQFSLHVLRHADAQPEWHSFIAGNEGDAPAEVVTELLSRIPPNGTVFVYGAGFELGVLAALAQQFPARAEELRELRARIVDMADPFQAFAVYHPGQMGKTSLKRVLPLLTGAGYDDLPMSDGMQASLAYYFLRRGQVPQQFGDDEKEVRSRLEQYCGLDTYALYLLWNELTRQRNIASISFR